MKQLKQKQMIMANRETCSMLTGDINALDLPAHVHSPAQFIRAAARYSYAAGASAVPVSTTANCG